MAFCGKCGSELDNNQKFCSNCGSQVDGNNSNSKNKINVNKITCPKCGSENVNIQIVSEQQLVTAHHGILWWMFVGWWWIFVKWLILTIPALLAAIFIGKRKKIKNTQKKVRICQSCGHSW